MKSEIMSFNSSFFEYLCGFIWFGQDRLEALMKRYPIGATEQGEPIFWHINSENNITNGHILTMDSETGKVYDNSWYYQDGRPTCLFGEYLLDSFPTQTVALVKDEMTAAIMSCFPTPYIWLATGKGKATPTDLKAQGDCHTIAQMVLSQQPLRPTEAEAALMRMEEANPNITLLVKALDLEVVGFSPIGDNVKDETPRTKPASKKQKEDAVMQSILLAQEKRWHGRNPECHKCHLSHEGVNGTFCGKLHRYVEYGKGDCGFEAEIPPAPE